MKEKTLVDIVLDEKYAFCVKLSEAKAFAKKKLKELNCRKAEVFFVEEYDLLFEVFAD